MNTFEQEMTQAITGEWAAFVDRVNTPEEAKGVAEAMASSSDAARRALSESGLLQRFES